MNAKIAKNAKTKARFIGKRPAKNKRFLINSFRIDFIITIFKSIILKIYKKVKKIYTINRGAVVKVRNNEKFKQ